MPSAFALGMFSGNLIFNFIMHAKGATAQFMQWLLFFLF